MQNENLTYEEMLAELQSIRQSIEDNTVSVDELAHKVSRAYTLIELCKNRLRSTGQQISQIINDNTND
jgi:exodeoxyribonuclease VII small subunit